MSVFGRNTIVLTYNRFLDSFGSGDGMINLQRPIVFPAMDERGKQPPRYLQIVQANFSKYIANVMKITEPFSYDNTVIRWTTNGGTDWFPINLPPGNYSLATIQDAINFATTSILTNKDDGCFIIAPNLATGRVYVMLDDKKCNVPEGTYQLGIDFGADACPDIAEFLGFEKANATFIGDNIYSAPNPAQLNLSGDSVSIELGGFGTLSNKDGVGSAELCNVPMITWSPSANEFTYPLFPVEKPLILLQQVPQTVSSYSVAFKGTRVRNGKQWPIYFMEGQVNLSFQLIF